MSAYTLTKSDGTPLATIAEGEINTLASALKFPGPNYVGYGQYLNQNLLYLLENFSSDNPPQSTNLEGQLWFDKFNQTLKVFTDQGYKSVSGITNAGTQPAVSKNGDIWFNTGTNQAFLYNEGSYNLLGPQYTKSQGISGAIPAVLTDAFGNNHNVLQLKYGNSVFATVSGDLSFALATPVAGFSSINPGITFSNQFTPTINSNLVGSVIGNLTGDVTAINVVATQLSGNLTGNVVGNVTGDVRATTLRGSLFGDIVGTNGQITNFKSSNVFITGGNIRTSVSFVDSADMIVGVATIFTAQNFSTGNALITGGTAALSTISATTGTFGVLNSGAVNIAGGTITGLTNLTTTTASAINFTSPSAVITGGSTDGLNTVSSTYGTFTNFSTANAVIIGGSLNNIEIGASSQRPGRFSTLASPNATITTLALTTLTGPIDANIGTLSLTLSNTATGLTTLQSNFGTYEISTNANLGTTFNGVNSISANLGLFQTRTSANVGTLTNTVGGIVGGVIPVGGIILWSGTASTIPTNWALCDGTNTTPDLRGRFVMGASATVGNVGARGGSSDAVVVSHTHTADSASTGITINASRVTSTGTAQGGAAPVVTGSTTGTLADPTHTHSIQSSGVSGAGANLPPYYALCYIMRTA